MTSKKNPKPRRPSKKANRQPSRESPTADNSPSLSEDEELDLEAFCKITTWEEVELAAWDKSHSALHVTVPVWIAAVDAQSGVERQVSFSRNVVCELAPKGKRVQVTQPVRIPAEVANGSTIVVKGQGDMRHDLCGDLIVIVYVKSGSK